MGPVDGVEVSRLGQRVFREIELLAQAGDRRGERLRARRRLRAGAGLPPAHRLGERALRPARGEAGHHPRLRRHAPPPAPRGEGPRAGDDPHRRDDRRARRRTASAWSTAWSPPAELLDETRALLGTILAQRPRRPRARHRVRHPRAGDGRRRRPRARVQPLRPPRRHRGHARGDGRLPGEAAGRSSRGAEPVPSPAPRTRYRPPTCSSSSPPPWARCSPSTTPGGLARAALLGRRASTRRRARATRPRAATRWARRIARGAARSTSRASAATSPLPLARPRHPLPARGVGRAARDPLRRDALLRRGGPRARPPGRRARRGPGQRPQPRSRSSSPATASSPPTAASAATWATGARRGRSRRSGGCWGTRGDVE